MAVLEKLAHVDFDLLPDDLFIAELEIPNSNLKLKAEELPKNWSNYPSPDRLKWIGEDWITENRYLVLEVPSAINPKEVNYILNVAHKEFSQVKIKDIYPFKIDDRLTRK